MALSLSLQKVRWNNGGTVRPYDPEGRWSSCLCIDLEGVEGGNYETFYYISVATSIWVFPLELYERKFSYTVLRGLRALGYL